jgi:WD40 repeat protein
MQGHLYSQKYKYIGHKNVVLPIRASMKQDGTYIISGSENGKVYIWNRKSDFVPVVNPGLLTQIIIDHSKHSYHSHPKKKCFFLFLFLMQ